MRRAVTLPETLIIALAIGLTLLLVALGTDTVQQDLKRRRTEQLLALLDRALAAYHQAVGQWPADPEADAPPAAADENDGSGDRIIAVLAARPESRKLLDRVPALMRAQLPRPTSSAATQPWGSARDAWGRPLRCLTAGAGSPADAEAVAANNGKPIFISPGPDGLIGRKNPADAADNLRSDRR